MDIEEKLFRGYLRCNMIVEVLGKPREHVEETMRQLLKKLREENGVDLLEGKVHKPKEQGMFFSSFVELEALVKDLGVFVTLCFEYMPSSVEIVEPENMRLKASSIADFVNDMLARLHQVDMRFKNVNAANELLEKNLRSLLRNFVMLLLEKGARSLDDLSHKIGIVPKELSPFLKLFEEEEILVLAGDKYRKK